MQTKHKIQAFTLSEMIVVIILTSIVVGMAFSVLSLVQKHMTSIQTNFYRNTELNKLEQSLWIDFNKYSKIEYHKNDDELIFKTALDAVKYKFTDGLVIKELDTFNISIEQKMMFFDGDITNNKNVDALKLITSKLFRNQSLFVFKQNDATLYLN